MNAVVEKWRLRLEYNFCFIHSLEYFLKNPYFNLADSMLSEHGYHGVLFTTSSCEGVSEQERGLTQTQPTSNSREVPFFFVEGSTMAVQN